MDILLRVAARRILHDVLIADPTCTKIVRRCATSYHPPFAVRDAAKVERACASTYPRDEFAPDISVPQFVNVLRLCACETPTASSLRQRGV